MQQKIEQYINYFKALTKREKIVLTGLAALLAAFILVGGVISPVVTYRAKLADSVRSKDDQLRKIYELSAKIRTVSELARNGHAAQPPNFTLFGFLEELATKARMNDRIEYMKPITDPTSAAKEVVELKIRAIYQEDLINILYDIEHSPYSLLVKRLNVKRVESDSSLDVIFQVVRYG